MPVEFAKMCGCGNDFIVVDNRDDVLPCARDDFARRHCRRRLDLGADGVVLIEPSADCDFRMRIFNADGSEAEMCGNGARCAAMFARRRSIAGATMTMQTLAGPVAARILGDDVEIGMGRISDIRLDIDLDLDGQSLRVSFAEAGVPHVAVFVDDVDAADVDAVGRAIRYHEAFAPRGTNVNFVQVLSRGLIRVRTYERGVEAETMACGTGSIASAVLSHKHGRTDPPVGVETSGGPLKIGFRSDADGITLEGNAVTVCEGTIPGE
jgi:diaminopimelate epimerase